MINWPTAFVIAVAMICGAVLMNKPSDAAFGGGDSNFGSGGASLVWQSSGDKIRWCHIQTPEGNPTPKCSPYR